MTLNFLFSLQFEHFFSSTLYKATVYLELFLVLFIYGPCWILTCQLGRFCKAVFLLSVFIFVRLHTATNICILARALSYTPNILLSPA